MSRSRRAYDRRTVLKTIGGSVSFAGAVGLASADDNVCVEPRFDEGDVVQTAGDDGSAAGYDDCEDPSFVFEIENGHCGRVEDLCCSEYGWLYLIAFEERDEGVWVREGDLDGDCITPD